MKNKVFKIFILLFFIITVGYCLKIMVLKMYPIYYKAYILKYSSENSLDPYLVTAVIKTESNFNSNAKSNKSANGLMQITDDTGQWISEQMNLTNFKTSDLNDPETNIKMGCWYLNNLKQEFNGNMDLVLAAYNGGRGNVKNWLQSKEHSQDGKNLQYIPFKETDKYIKRVKVNYNIYKVLYKNLK